MTGPVDSVRDYYRPVVGPLLRRRAVWIEDVLRGRPPDNLLEIGYGSGILLPTLNQFAKKLFAVDVHPMGSEVHRSLEEAGVDVALSQASGERLPFPDNVFGAVVIASTLSFIEHPDRALREAVRVLRPGGRLVALIPRNFRAADRAWEILTGRSPERDFEHGRTRARAALETELPVSRWQRRPRRLPAPLAPYELVIFDKPLSARGLA